MKTRSGPAALFHIFILLLVVMVALQAWSLVQSRRLYERLDELFGRFLTADTSAQTAAPAQDRYPGDDGDWLIWRIDAEPATLNPVHTLASVYTLWICKGYVSNNIFEGLLKYDPDELQLKPLLAESYSVSDDGLKITFRLRDDIHFSDGHPVTADDVIFTYETITNPRIDAASLANYYRDVKEVVKISDRQVRFIMKRPYFKSLEIVGFDATGILPKHIYDFNDPEQFNKRISDPVGSGPYVFEKWDIGREIVLRRNENYWGPKPKLKKIVYRIILNDTAAVQALRAEQIDFMRPLPGQYTELSKDPQFTSRIRCLSYWTPFVGYFWMGWNQDRPFFKDRRVRLAMTHLVDRQLICRKLLRVPDARVPTGPFYIYGRQSDPNIQPWPYDPEKAEQLLNQAGWIDTDGDGIRDKDGVPFRFRYMMVSGVSLHRQIAKLLKDEAAKVGIDVIVEPYEWSIFSQRLLDRQFDAVNLAWHGDVEEDPYQIWHSSQTGNRGSNYVGFRSAEADELIERARKTLDRTERNRLYRRLHQIIHEQQPYTFIYTRPEQRFLHRRFQNVRMHRLGLDKHEWYVPKEQQKYK